MRIAARRRQGSVRGVEPHVSANADQRKLELGLKLVEAGNAVCAHAATVLAAASAVTAVGVGHARCEALDENAEHREHEEVARRGEHCVVM